METNTPEFLEEKKHLLNTQKDINSEIEEHKHKMHSCSANIKDNLDYEAVSAWQQETARSERLQRVVDDLRKQYRDPYYGRIDLVNSDTGDKEKLYIGKSDIVLNDTDLKVVSWQSDFGDFYNAEKTEGVIGETNYYLDLRRGIYIKDGKLNKVETSFQSGLAFLGEEIVDPLLLAIMKDKRRQSQPTEIIATINKKQNEFIRLPANQDFVIQGCAGSGKTMVLFHRLSVLLYRQNGKGIQRFCIVTPNENFNSFMEKLSESLDLRGIRIRSAGSYYMDLIESFGVAVNRKVKIQVESALDHDVLSTVYSPEFQQEIQSSFQKVWTEEIKKLTEIGFFTSLRQKGINLGNVKLPTKISYNHLKEALNSLRSLLDDVSNREEEVSRLLEAAIKNQKSLSEETEQRKLQKAAQKINEYVEKEKTQLDTQIKILQIDLGKAKRKIRPVSREYLKISNDIAEKNRELEELQTFLQEKDVDVILKYRKYSNLYSNVRELERQFTKLGNQHSIKAMKLEQSIDQSRTDFMKEVCSMIREDIASIEKELDKLKINERETDRILSTLSKESEQLQLQFDRLTDKKNRLNKLPDVFQSQENSAYPGGLKAYEDFPPVHEYCSRKENILWIRDKIKSLPQEVAKLQQDLHEVQKEKEQLGIDNKFLNSVATTIGSMSFRKLFATAVKKPVYELLGLEEKSVSQYHFELYLMLYCCTLYFPRVRQEEDLVCIDEAQDLSEAELLTLKKVLGKNCNFNLYGDTNQLLYPYKGIHDWKKCGFTSSMPIYELNQNYRNTRQITEFCNDEIGMDVLSIGIEGIDVKTVPQAQLRLALIQCVPTENRSVAVIYSQKNKEIPDLLIRHLGHKQVAVGELYPKKVSVLTVEEAKGLEFYSVLVLPEGMTRNELYVAYTRALHELRIVR